MAALLVSLLIYIGSILPYDAATAPPAVAFVPQQQLKMMLWPDQSADFRNHNRVYGLYRWSEKTVYLPDDFSADDPDDVAVLVHELVHHLQVAALLPPDWTQKSAAEVASFLRQRFPCPQTDMEEEAYAVQEHWLSQRLGQPIEIERGHKTYVAGCAP